MVAISPPPSDSAPCWLRLHLPQNLLFKEGCRVELRLSLAEQGFDLLSDQSPVTSILILPTAGNPDSEESTMKGVLRISQVRLDIHCAYEWVTRGEPVGREDGVQGFII